MFICFVRMRVRHWQPFVHHAEAYASLSYPSSPVPNEILLPLSCSLARSSTIKDVDRPASYLHSATDNLSTIDMQGDISILTNMVAHIGVARWTKIAGSGSNIFKMGMVCRVGITSFMRSMHGMVFDLFQVKMTRGRTNWRIMTSCALNSDCARN